MPRSIAPSRAPAAIQMSGGSRSRDSPTTVTATSARSRRAKPSSIAELVVVLVPVIGGGLPRHRRSRPWPPSHRSRHAIRLARGPGEKILAGSGVEHGRRGDPCPPRLADPPAHVVELADVVGVGVDRDQAAEPDRAAGPLDGEVQPRRRAVHLEGGPRSGRLRVDRVPVEVEVVPLADLAAGRMGDDVDVRAPDGIERALGQLGTGLATGDVDRCDDHVEARQQVVLEVERGVGAHLELAAVEEPEATGRCRRRGRAGRFLRREPGVERGDHLDLLRDPVRGQARAIASDCEWSVRTW